MDSNIRILKDANPVSNDDSNSILLQLCERDKAELQQETSSLRAEIERMKSLVKPCQICPEVALAYQNLSDYQVLPFVPDYTDGWFRDNWMLLDRRILEWANTGYHFVPNSRPLRRKSKTLIVIFGNERNVKQIYNSEQRHYLVVARVWKILHDEVFAKLRRMVTVSIPETLLKGEKSQKGQIQNMKGDIATLHPLPRSTAINTCRAKLMKALFTDEDEPFRLEMMKWRSQVVDKVWVYINPLKVPNVESRAMRSELWGIVKDAMKLAATMACQWEIVKVIMAKKELKENQMRHIFGNGKVFGPVVTPMLKRGEDRVLVQAGALDPNLYWGS